MIVRVLLVQFNLNVSTSQRIPQKNQAGSTMKRGQMPLTVNMVFDDD